MRIGEESLEAAAETLPDSEPDKQRELPLATYERIFGASESLQVFARARDVARTTEAEDRTRATMRARRRLSPGVADTFDLLSPTAARGFVAGLTLRVSAAAFPLSAMALLASIVVVTNTTLVSGTQRTREIGVRRALGATRRQVAREVVVESTLVALAGGAAGLLAVLGLAAAAPAQQILNVSYDPTRELYREFNRSFAAAWQAKAGGRVTISQSHGWGSSAAKPRHVSDRSERALVS